MIPLCFRREWNMEWPSTLPLAARGNRNLDQRRVTRGVYTVILRNKRGCFVEILLKGGQVISWKNEYGEELLFLGTREADFGSSNPVVGGIPICFPVVSDHGHRDLLELTRYRVWKTDDYAPPLPTCSLNAKYVDLILKPNEDDLQLWPHRFVFRLRVILGLTGDLILISRIQNMNNTKCFSFRFAYRNHLRVSNINKVRVEGLGTLMRYIDNLEDKETILDEVDTLTVESKVDKVFLKAHSKISVIDQQKRRVVIIRKEGLCDAGVWNPGREAVQLEGDNRNDEYNKMVCIEPAAVEEAITLKPGEMWTGIQELSVVPATYFF